MLVIADKLRSGAEKRVVSWLRKWQDDYRVPGVAIANCFVSGQEVDLVIITPHTTVVCEIKGVNPGVTSGILQCTSNSRWKVAGFEGDPVGVRQNDITPYDQVREGVFKLKKAAAQAGGPAFVTGLVVVVPPRGSQLRLDKKSAPQGCDVLLCTTQNPLRAWFHRAHHRSAVVWTAEQAYALIEALEHGDSITVEALTEEGFPSEAPPRPATPRDPAHANPAPPSSSRQLPPAPGMPPPPASPLPAPSPTPASPRPAPTPASRPLTPTPAPTSRRPTPPPASRPRIPTPAPAPQPSPPTPAPSRPPTATPPPAPRANDPGPAAAEPPPPRETPAPESAPEPPPPESPLPPEPEISGNRQRRIHTAVAVAAIGVLSAGIWFVAQLGNGRNEPRETVGHPQNSAVTEQTTVPPPPVSETSRPARTACFPFQPAC